MELYGEIEWVACPHPVGNVLCTWLSGVRSLLLGTEEVVGMSAEWRNVHCVFSGVWRGVCVRVIFSHSPLPAFNTQ